MYCGDLNLCFSYKNPLFHCLANNFPEHDEAYLNQNSNDYFFSSCQLCNLYYGKIIFKD